MFPQKQNIKKGFLGYFIRNRGQSSLEYAILIMVILGAFIGAGAYFKRGVQGRWKGSVDDLGDQYDPRVANTNVRHVMYSSTQTRVESLFDDVSGGWWTSREDLTNSMETRTGYEGVEASY